MFDSGISVKELVDELIAEVDVALDIPEATYITWLNSLQQMLYTEVIKEQKKIAVETNNGSVIDLSLVGANGNENKIGFEDIHAVYTNDGRQLIKSTVASGVIFPDSYYKLNNNLGYNTKPLPTELTIVYFVKPALVKEETYANMNVMLPIEFIELAKAKLRGEAYQLANEFDYAANWLNSYNNLLETFKLWIADKSPKFGL